MSIIILQGLTTPKLLTQGYSFGEAVLRVIRMVFTVAERVDMTFKLHEVK